jgi:UDP:flavonoid glycosyltransferase YjiC (YdhE family)
MSNVFFAWELGANLGHMGSFLPLARLLRDRGHKVHWVLAKTHEAAGLLRPHGFSWMQAPTSHDHAPGRTPENYASILLHFGYARPQTLLGMVEAWRSLMLLCDADVVVVDHAPTAILAARTLGLPVMNHGNGFTVPPPVHPTPQFRSWREADPAVLLANDQAALSSINWVLGELGCPPLARLADLFDMAEPALLTFPELDHYAHRGAARYWGIAPPATGVTPQWPSVPGPKVFAYVRPTGKHHGAVLDALKQLDASVLVVAPGASSELRERLASPNLAFAAGGVNLRLAAQEASLGVLWSGGGNTALAFLLAGTPVVILPNQIEPFLQGLRVQQMGAGLVADLDTAQEALPVLLARALIDSSLRDRAAEFALRYQGVSGEPQLQKMASRLEELARGIHSR